ncbi:hypothetical protein B4U37_21690 (plasmid) [Sutcliffiella horikoshii]|uniref:Type III toxin-antitoxin system ToxN/AbiQ family toxin n=1 Tax=Sutcliffiella horikoshii TaxID=79883 RepID=A0ABM6KQK3_9BACI|nr:type III toxin-antitoxin system ToxN/AbiQ family toxin [Sutcliffiella horikoshii]ART78727.1 hypothetical protein B4U37_21690 [Sutcliffiella horikoshii]
MMLCGIESSYLDFLRKTDKNVSTDPTKNRKFVGILFEVNGYIYCAPLTSPKPKHKKMSDKQPDIYKVDSGKLGLINLNNMIPVTESVIIRIDINKEPQEDYRNLMTKQMIHIRKDEDLIKKKANKLYKIVGSGKQPKLNDRCCDFIELEKAAPGYILSQQQTASAISKPATK